MESLQQRFAPSSICFGCGPANEKGLRINSVPDGEFVVADWNPSNHHEAFPGMLNGGIIGALLDCHSNWTAAWHLMNQSGEESPPCTVTAEYKISLRRPTPSNQPVRLKAWLREPPANDRAWIEAELSSGGKVCATCVGLFVAVQPGHPAYHRWG
jgi:acyl-coenzyme A thioesterase PaaI-like protein